MMRTFGVSWGCFLVAVALASGCGRAEETKPVAEAAAPSKQVSLEALTVARTFPLSWGKYFNNSQSCAFCHSNHDDAKAMRGPKGESIAPYDLWASSMMANATRDPFWRAVVSAEVASAPQHKAVIEKTCMRCHAPMAHVDGAKEGGPTPSLGTLNSGEMYSQYALDGVSCALCHQIRPEILGKPESFSGRYEIGDERVIFGPHADPFKKPMVERADFTPTRGDHINASALCGSCHVLFTDVVTPSGEPTDKKFLEQAVYLEWQNSSFSDERSPKGSEAQTCQGCHMPTVDSNGQALQTRIARDPHGEDFEAVAERTPYGQHVFVGGNTIIPAIIRDHPEVFRPIAPPEAFDATIARARRQLQNDTATLAIRTLERDGERLQIDVAISNLTGHKLPTGHPSRRAWLRLTVRDAKGEARFDSGRFDARGRLLDSGGEVHAADRAGGGTHPHHAIIREPSQVHVIEVVMGNTEGAVTHSLIRAATHLKDNRLLPRGWRSDAPGVELIAPRGLGVDPDHVGGEDVVHYEVEAPAGAGPYEVEAALIYQTAGARYVAELFTHDTPEVAAFRAMFEAANVTPEVLATARASE